MFGYIPAISKNVVSIIIGTLRHVLDDPNDFSTSQDDYFGSYVALDNNKIVITATGEDDNNGTMAGKAYVFDAVTGNLLLTLDNPNVYGSSTNDYFGPVDISGNTIVIGVYAEDYSGGNNSGTVYTFDATTGAHLLTINDPNDYGTPDGDLFGISVAIEGNVIIVGASGEDYASGINSGRVYAFNATTGALLYTIDNPNAHGTPDSDHTGRMVDLSGNLGIFGSRGESDAGGTDSGKAHIFDVTTGNVLLTIDNPNAYGTSQDDFFGRSVAIDGNIAVVGAVQEDSASGSNDGKVYIFNATTGALQATIDNPNATGPGTNDYFGWNFSIVGSRVLIGAPYEDNGPISNSGIAYLFDANNGNLIHTFNNPNVHGTEDSDAFGWNVAMYGHTAVITANWESDAGGTMAGKAYVYDV